MADTISAANYDLSNGFTVTKAYKLVRVLTQFPRWLKMILARLLDKYGLSRLAAMTRGTTPLNPNDFFRDVNKKTYINQMWFNMLKEKNVDFIVSPGFGLPPMKPGTSGDLVLSCFYTFFYNYTGMPAGVIPVTTVREDEQHYETRHRDPTAKLSIDCVKGSAGLPVGVQIASLPFNDEKCLGLMKHIEQLMDLKPFLKC